MKHIRDLLVPVEQWGTKTDIGVTLAAPTAPQALRLLFQEAVCNQNNNIHSHLEVMRNTASGQKHITEMGVGCGYSTLAWLLVQPERLVLIDRGDQAILPVLNAVKGRTEVVFIEASTQDVEIEKTDVLFIDTYHTFAQLSTELRLHGEKARRYIVMHDTFTFGVKGEDGSTPGLWQAVVEFLGAHKDWAISYHSVECNGLTILRRGA